MGNTVSHPSNSTGPTTDQLTLGGNASAYPGALAAESHGGRTGRERSGTRDRTDRDRDAPAKPPSPPPPSTPLLLPYAGHFSPQNPHCLSHPQVHDFNKTVVSQLLLDNQLAPFYRGLDDFEEEWTELDIRGALDAAREKDVQEDVKNSYTIRLKEERGGGKKWGSSQELAERARREDKAYLGAVECPICFLNYPPNINTSRCCQQPLCTECFVQIKRGEATVTHLESEPACCPYCVETDFGVIYERPTPVATPTEGVLGVPQHALASSPDASASGFSALSLSEEPGSGSGTPVPKPPAPRRKSVSSKAKEVITIDQIRPDWESKLNAVKSQAARRAARRIVMRQVGDRLIPIGYTSSRATGQADFSMSLPSQEGRRERRTRERERELEEMMIMEAMRLSMIDHEEHQRKQAEDDQTPGSQPAAGAGGAPSAASAVAPAASSALAAPTQSSTPSSSRRSSSAGATLSSWRASQNNHDSGGRAQAAASKLLSKINVTRSRANSKSSVHFAASPTTMGASPSNSHPASVTGHGDSSVRNRSPNRNRSSSTPSPNPMSHQQNHVQSPLAHDVTENGTNAGATSVDTPMILQNSVPFESPAAMFNSMDDAAGLLGPVLTPDSAGAVLSGPSTGAAAASMLHNTDTDMTPSSSPPRSSMRTAANPHPELAALMADAFGEEDDSQPSPAAKSSAQGIPEAAASNSDLISVSSLASTPPTGLEERPAVPLSAMADDDDD